MTTTDTAVQLDDPSTYLDGPPHDFFDHLRRNEPVHWHESPNYPPGAVRCSTTRPRAPS